MFLQSEYRLPAEWEPQSGVQLTWPHAKTDWAPMLNEITETYRAITAAISRFEPVLIVEPPSNDTWARDHGFITLVRKKSNQVRKSVGKENPENSDARPLLLDFKFNGWGEKFAADLDNAINRRIFEKGLVRGKYVDQQDFVLEGGSIESDGKGTIFTTTGCLMAPHRNQPLTQRQIENRLKESLCAERIVWIDHGGLTGDDTDGHIDTLVRICPDDTILYVGCDNPKDEQYEELCLMEKQLHTLRTLEGHPYRLIKLPMPRPIYEESDRLPATYANFLIVNGGVICPTYGQKDLDEEALRLIGTSFPGRQIVGIDCRSIIKQHGSLHCCTMQYPLGCISSESSKTDMQSAIKEPAPSIPLSE
jgi:agmatine deiminase